MSSISYPNCIPPGSHEAFRLIPLSIKIGQPVFRLFLIDKKAYLLVDAVLDDNPITCDNHDNGKTRHPDNPTTVENNDNSLVENY
ncbi:hypothetical protein [Mangrovibacterium marinum]|uniref:hypothetical protein n=1 Tax=Mangrovibacterium marinum TaxID=1639118 RepID=UPI000D320464|nr:hypothetical protein [Mangrovibacterium marinum]